MKHQSSIFFRILFVSIFALLTITASAQFKKPLTSPRDQIQSSEAKWNVGILGGGNLTTWLHFHSLESSNWYLKNYKPFDTITNSLGYFGGIAVERKIKSNVSVGLNVVYAQHNVQLSFMNDNFPIEWDTTNAQINYGRIVKGFKAKYQTIEAYIPISYYIGLASSKNIIPYVYVAPRFSYILPIDGNMMYYSSNYTDSNNVPLDTIHYSLHPVNDSVSFNRSTYRSLNIGATVGVGSLFKINVGNYYFLLKFDVSANLNGVPTHKKGEVDNDEFKYLRFSTDAHATVTLLLPLKKQLQGACMKWGEYD